MKYTIMLNVTKRELRVVYLGEDAIGGFESLRHLPEHKDNPPKFATADEGWEFIREQYPHLQP